MSKVIKPTGYRPLSQNDLKVLWAEAEAREKDTEALKSERPKGEWYILEYEYFTCN